MMLDIARTMFKLNIRASILIELRKIYRCPYDEFFYGLDHKDTQ